MIVGAIHAGAEDVGTEDFLAGGTVRFLSTHCHLIGGPSVSLPLEFGGQSQELLASVECDLEIGRIHIKSIIVSFHEILLSPLIPHLVK